MTDTTHPPKKESPVTISFWSLLFLLLLTLKLVGLADISWWFVFIPFWGPIALFGGILLLFVAYEAMKDIATLVKRKFKR